MPRNLRRTITRRQLAVLAVAILLSPFWVLNLEKWFETRSWDKLLIKAEGPIVEVLSAIARFLGSSEVKWLVIGALVYAFSPHAWRGATFAYHFARRIPGVLKDRLTPPEILLDVTTLNLSATAAYSLPDLGEFRYTLKISDAVPQAEGPDFSSIPRSEAIKGTYPAKNAREDTYVSLRKCLRVNATK
jgi:hypothetical protein